TRWWMVPAFALATGAAATAWFATRADEPVATAKLNVPKIDVTPVELVKVPDPVAITGLVTLAQGDVALAGAHDVAGVFGSGVVAGTAITTGDGHVDVQLDAGPAFGIGAHSKLAIARLDSQVIQLDVDGSITVEVSHRAPDQRFLVVAGDRTV